MATKRSRATGTGRKPRSSADRNGGALWKEQPSSLDIRSSRKVKPGVSYLSRIAMVHTEDGGYGKVHIDFPEDVVDMLGKHMPRGIGPEDPAFLSVTWMPDKQAYYVAVGYIRDRITADTLLWVTDSLPDWAKKIHVPL